MASLQVSAPSAHMANNSANYVGGAVSGYTSSGHLSNNAVTTSYGGVVERAAQSYVSSGNPVAYTTNYSSTTGQYTLPATVKTTETTTTTTAGGNLGGYTYETHQQGGAGYQQQGYTTGTTTMSGGAGYQQQGYTTGTTTMSGGATGDMTSTSYEQSRRKVSSVVISEQMLEQPRQDGVRYVEVPIIEEVVKTIPVRKVVEVEKRVPKITYDYVERVVEVPRIEYVDKEVPVVQYRENIVHVSKKEVVTVPKEVIKVVEVPGPVVEKLVEVPGPVIPVEKPYTVENKIPVVKYQDIERPVVVAQTVQPVVVEGTEAMEVEVLEYEPQVVVVDVHVAKPISSQIIAAGVKEEMHRVVQVPAAQYNTILRTLNPHVMGVEAEQSLPFMREAGQVPYLTHSEFASTVSPHSNVTIEGYNAAMTHRRHEAATSHTHRGTRSAEVYDNVIISGATAGQQQAYGTTNYNYGTYGSQQQGIYTNSAGMPVMGETYTTTTTTHHHGHHHDEKKSHHHHHDKKSHRHHSQKSARGQSTSAVVPAPAPPAHKKKACAC